MTEKTFDQVLHEARLSLLNLKCGVDALRFILAVRRLSNLLRRAVSIPTSLATIVVAGRMLVATRVAVAAATDKSYSLVVRAPGPAIPSMSWTKMRLAGTHTSDTLASRKTI